jgi:phosphatidate phosphatase APP1
VNGERSPAGSAWLGFISLLLLVFWCAGSGKAAAYDCLDLRVMPLYSTGQTLFEGMVVEGKPQAGTGRRQRFLSFFADAAASAAIELRVATFAQTLHIDAEGVFSVTLPVLLTSGTVELRETASGTRFFQRSFEFPARADFVLISDIDDTVLESDVPHKVRLVLKTIFKTVKGRRPVSGTPQLYRDLANKSPLGQPLIIFLSSSPSTLSRFLNAFLDQNGFPQRFICLKRSLQAEGLKAREHKLKWLKRLAGLYAGIPLLLLGDSGELDPEIYTEFLESTNHLCLGVVMRSLDQNLIDPRWVSILERLTKRSVPFFLWYSIETLREQLKKAGLLPS